MRLIIVLRFARLSSGTEEAVCGWRGKGRAFRLFFRETPRGICTAPTTFRPDTLSVQRARERLRSGTGRQSPGKTQREGDIQLIPSPVQKCLQTNQRENHRPDAATSPPARQHTCARRRTNPPPRGGAGAPPRAVTPPMRSTKGRYGLPERASASPKACCTTHPLSWKSGNAPKPRQPEGAFPAFL